MRRCVEVVVFGEPGAGKSTVVAALNGRWFSRWRDRQSFQFKASLADDCQRQVDMALVVVDATNPRESDDMLRAAKQAAHHAAVVVMKADLLTREYHQQSSYLEFLELERSFAYYNDLETTSLNPSTPVGAESLREFIANAVAPPAAPLVDFHRWWKYCRSAFLDQVAACFSLSVKQHVPDVKDDLAAITSDSDVAALKDRPYALAWEEELKKRLDIDGWRDERLPMQRITPSLLAKSPSPGERASMEYVRAHTSIPVPRTHHPHLSGLLMDYIEGETLQECWGRLGWFMRFRVACTLRTYVNQLHALKRPTVGDLSGGRVNALVFSLPAQHAPFPSAHRYRRFCEFVSFTGWKSLAMNDARAGRTMEFAQPPRMRGDWAAVFIHGDLNSNNILLDRHGTLWLLDWGCAGFYPKGTESYAMHLVDEVIHRGHSAPLASYRAFIAGPADREEEAFWDGVLRASPRFMRW